MEARSSRRTFWLLWWTLAVVKLALAATVPLFGDEAWYWLEGQHPAWAYSDLPALTAWLTRAGVELAGHSWLGLRMPFLLMGLAVPLVMQRAAMEFAESEVSWRVALWSLLVPLLALLGPMALPDVPLTLAAAGTDERQHRRGHHPGAGHRRQGAA